MSCIEGGYMQSYMHSTSALLRTLLAAALIALAGSGSAWAQSLEVSTATELRASPVLNAKSLTTLAVGTRVEHIETRGGWVHIKVQTKVQTQQGWVRMTHMRTLEPTQAAASTSNPLTGLTGLFSANSNRPTATTGTRGLTQEELANAQPAPAEVNRMETFAVSPIQAQQFAKGGKLQAQTISAYSGAE